MPILTVPVALNMKIIETDGKYNLLMEHVGFSTFEEANHWGEAQAESILMLRTGLLSTAELEN
tara:strand:+ start:7928 stop:8116 length:189 start_codon:yes stop_codon:yes gene_type:complete